MQRIVATREAEASAPRWRKRRGLRGQRRRRRREQEVREAAVAFTRYCRWLGQGRGGASRHLRVSRRTLWRWERSWHGSRFPLTCRGRPPRMSPPHSRRAVYEALKQLGPCLGVPTLQTLFPDLARRELEELVRRFRHAHRRDRRQVVYALRWTRPGAIWAADFTEPPAPIHGVYDQLLCLRDVASTRTLSALPTIGKKALTVLDSLKAQVRWHGAPLVLKLDNDSVFTDRRVKAWARDNGVLLLYSPPYWPRYNGGAEHGIGALKVQAHYISARNDRPGMWTCDDIEAARMAANALGRPRGINRPTPEDMWRSRLPIEPEERAAFLDIYREHYRQERSQHNVLDGVQLQHQEQAEIDRVAIAAALIARGLLLIRRRRITLPIRRWKADKIA